MTIRRATLTGLAVAALSFVAAAALYDRLPESMPVHWNIHGIADGFMPKPWGVFFYPAFIGFFALLAAVLPAISPRGFRIEPFMRAFDVIVTALIVFFACLMIAIFAGALGFPIPVDRLLLAGIGILLATIGNVMGKTTPNFFVGIRTPWTLANSEVWLRTHRLGGRLFVVAGLALLGAAALGLDPFIPFLGLIGVPLVLTAYSYVLYRKLEK